MTNYREHHRQLLEGLDLHINKPGSDIEKIESCFKCSLDCWSMLQREVLKEGFENSAAEIDFFKHVKHQFTSHIEYYTNRYHALLFQPADNNEELLRFWNWEVKKIEKFYENNEAFFRYIRDGETDRDIEYFTRTSQKNTVLPYGRIHDLDPRFSTPQDYLLTIRGAYEMYSAYISQEIQKLGGYIFF